MADYSGDEPATDPMGLFAIGIVEARCFLKGKAKPAAHTVSTRDVIRMRAFYCEC
jgi:hypothetical protein